MNLNTLKMFDAAARHLNFRLAADELFLTQGAVAQRIRKLEQDLGVQLFLRHARGIALTERGEMYHRSIREALSLINKATQELTGEDSHLTISAPPAVVTKWLMPRIANFSDRYPDINVRISASESLTNFDHEDVDLAVRQGHAPTDSNLSYKQLADLPLLAVCAPGFLPEAQTLTTIEAFAPLKLLEDGHRSWERLLGQKPKQVLNLSHSHLAIDAAMNGQGIALVPKFLVEEQLIQRQLISVYEVDSEVSEGLFLVWPKQSTSSKPNRELLINWLITS